MSHRTISQFLEANPNSKKAYLDKNGDVKLVKTLEKWKEEEDKILLELLEKRTADAIRWRLWALLKVNNGKRNQKLK